MQIALVGLGKMGGNMVKRLMGGGHHVVGYDRDPAVVAKLAKEVPASGKFEGAASLEDVVKKLSAPRAVWVMVPSGKATEDTIQVFSGAAQPERHPHRRRQLELPRLAAPRGRARAEEDPLPRCRHQRRHLGARGRLLAHGRRRRERLQARRAGPHDARPEGRPRLLRQGRRGALHEDGPQRDRVRDDAGVRGGVRAPQGDRVRHRSAQGDERLEPRKRRPLLAPRARRACVQPRPGAEGAQGLGRRLGRRALDRERGHRTRRPGSDDRRVALRALLFAPGQLVRACACSLRCGTSSADTP